MSPIEHAFRGTRAAAVTLAAVCAGIVVWALYLERPFLSYQNLPFPVLQVAHTGETVPLSVERCNADLEQRRYNTTHGIRDLATGRFEVLPSLAVSIDPGCHRDVSRANTVPPDTPPGRYQFFGIAEVQGLLWMHKVAWYSEPFEVIP